VDRAYSYNLEIEAVLKSVRLYLRKLPIKAGMNQHVSICGLSADKKEQKHFELCTNKLKKNVLQIDGLRKLRRIR